jgi:hypothetical protein
VFIATAFYFILHGHAGYNPERMWIASSYGRHSQGLVGTHPKDGRTTRRKCHHALLSVWDHMSE